MTRFGVGDFLFGWFSFKQLKKHRGSKTSFFSPSHDPFEIELFEVLLQWYFITNQCGHVLKPAFFFLISINLCSSTTC